MSDQQGKSILAIDDDAALANMLGKMLKRRGYNVTVLTSSSEAIELVRESPTRFDLVVTDLTMPEFTGAKLAGEVRKIRSDLPVIVCTGSDEHPPPESREAGIWRVLKKPFEPEALESAVAELTGEGGQT